MAIFNRKHATILLKIESTILSSQSVCQLLLGYL